MTLLRLKNTKYTSSFAVALKQYDSNKNLMQKRSYSGFQLQATVCHLGEVTGAEALGTGHTASTVKKHRVV